jgi:1-acyl-sn-glycerol-3-phosphate acyltransferase
MATGFCFALFGLGGLCIGLIIIPAAAIIVRDPVKRIRTTRRIIGGSLAQFVWVMSTSGVLKYHVSGLDNVRDDANYLILANHPSLIDVVFLLAWFPEAVCIVKQEIFANPFMRMLATLAGYISNEDPAEMFAMAIQELNTGKSLILFPEGTRTTPGYPLEFKLTAAAIAVRTGQLVLPVVFTLRPTTLTKNNPWYRIPAEKVDFRMVIQPPFRPLEQISHTADKRRPDKELNQYLLEYFQAQLADNS